MVSSDGLLLYVTHNTVPVNVTEGLLSVVQVGRRQARIMTTLDSRPDSPGPYGPPAIAHRPLRGNYPFGDKNRNDLVVWGSAHLDSAQDWERGYVHLIQLSDLFDGESPQGARFEEIRSYPVKWSTLTPPVMSSSGLLLYFAVSKSEARGWSETSSGFQKRPTWKAEDLARDPGRRGKQLAAEGSPVLGPDDGTLYITSTVNAVYAIDAADGTVLWSDLDMPAIVKTRPVPSPDGERVYYACEDGTVVAKDTADGKTLWTHDLGGDVTELRSEMTLDADGSNLYLAGNAGTSGRYVYSLSLGSYVTESPTPSPVTRPPTAAPSLPIETAVPTTYLPTPAPATKSPVSSAPVVAARIETGGPTSSGPTTGAPMSSAPTSSERIMQSRAPTFDESGAGGRSGTIATLSTALTVLLAILMR